MDGMVECLKATFFLVPPPLGHTINNWWDGALARLPKEKKRVVSGTFIYVMWGVWKERNRRIFRNVALQSILVTHLVREEIVQRAFVHTQNPGDQV